MKKKLLTLLLTIVMGGNIFAATIDTERLHKDWSKLVDRVACEYVTSYIGALTSESAVDFMSNIAPQLVSAKGEYVSTQKLNELLVEHSFQRTAEVLIPELEKRKSIAAQDQTIDCLTDISNYSPAMQEYLRDAVIELKETLQDEYAATTGGKVKLVGGNEKDSAAQEDDFGQATATFVDYSTVIILIAIIAIETIFIILRTSRKRITEVVKESNLMRKTYIRKDDDDIVDLRDNMKKIWERMDRIENSNSSNTDSDSDNIKFTHL